MRHGKGFEIYPSLRHWYKGDWLYNKQEGQGECCLHEGCLYLCEFINDKPTRIGELKILPNLSEENANEGFTNFKKLIYGD